MCNFTEMKNKIYMHTSDKILPWWLSGKKKKKERKKEKDLTINTEDLGLSLAWENTWKNGNALQYFCLGTPMDRGA